MKLSLNSSAPQSRQTKEQFANPDADLDYELGKAVQELPPLYTRLVAVSLSLGLFGAVAWAAFSKVDEVAVAHGKVILGDERPVRSLSSGKIKDIKVKEGQQVQQDDVLVALDFKSDSDEIEKLNNIAQSKRQNIQRFRQSGDASQKARIKGAEVELSGLQKDFILTKTKANRLRNIVGAISRIEVENAQQEVQDLETKIAAKQQEIQQLRPNYNTGNLSELSKQIEELRNVEGQLAQAKIQRQNKIITAPISGKVYNIKVNASQGAVQANEELLSISPEGKEPLLEVDLPNQYRGFVDENMNAKVKIDAFPYQEYGVIEGTVISVSPDASVKDKNLGKEVYPTKIKLHKVTIRVRGQDKPLTPGMEATGEIVMRQKSILSLLLEPVTRKFDEVFSHK